MITSESREGAGIWRVLLLVLLAKVLIFSVGVLCFEVYMDQRVVWPMGFFAIWNRWDCPTYLEIAEKGYIWGPDEFASIAFFPLYPLCIRLLMLLQVTPIVAAFLVSGAASLGVGVLLYRLVQKDFPDTVAWNSVWFLSIFPTAYFLHIGMTESLFLLLTLASFLLGRNRRWLWAGTLGALASLTRMAGIWLIPALLVEAWFEYRQTRRFNPEWLCVAFVGLGTLTYLWMNQRVTGDPFAFITYQREHWNHRPAWPWDGVRIVFSSIRWLSPSNAQMGGWQEGIFVVLGLWTAVMAAWRLRPSYAVWAGGNWIMIASMDFMTSNPRYLLAFFPLFILLGRLPSDSLRHRVISLCFILLMGVFISLWVQGRWAF